MLYFHCVIQLSCCLYHEQISRASLRIELVICDHFLVKCCWRELESAPPWLMEIRVILVFGAHTPDTVISRKQSRTYGDQAACCSMSEFNC